MTEKHLTPRNVITHLAKVYGHDWNKESLARGRMQGLLARMFPKLVERFPQLLLAEKPRVEVKTYENIEQAIQDTLRTYGDFQLHQCVGPYQKKFDFEVNTLGYDIEKLIFTLGDEWYPNYLVTKHPLSEDISAVQIFYNTTFPTLWQKLTDYPGEVPYEMQEASAIPGPSQILLVKEMNEGKVQVVDVLGAFHNPTTYSVLGNVVPACRQVEHNFEGTEFVRREIIFWPLFLDKDIRWNDDESQVGWDLFREVEFVAYLHELGHSMQLNPQRLSVLEREWDASFTIALHMYEWLVKQGFNIYPGFSIEEIKGKLMMAYQTYVRGIRIVFDDNL